MTCPVVAPGAPDLTSTSGCARSPTAMARRRYRVSAGHPSRGRSRSGRTEEELRAFLEHGVAHRDPAAARLPAARDRGTVRHGARCAPAASAARCGRWTSCSCARSWPTRRCRHLGLVREGGARAQRIRARPGVLVARRTHGTRLRRRTPPGGSRRSVAAPWLGAGGRRRESTLVGAAAARRRRPGRATSTPGCCGSSTSRSGRRSRSTVTIAMPGGAVVEYRARARVGRRRRLRARDRMADIERTLPLSSIAAIGPS